MLSKRRITVTHVDDAILCGGEGSFHHIVSVFNGADHPQKTPVPSEEPPRPSVSRLLTHTFHGAVEVDVQLSPTDEYVLTAAANEAGVVACRVCPAPPSSGFCRAAAWHAATAHRLVFFSGRQRLAEVVLDSQLTAEARDGGGSTADAWQATFEQWRAVSQRFPIQCVRAADGVDAALLVTAPRVLCVCTPHACKEQYLTVECSDIVCVGGGRQGRGEATVLLEDGTVLLCSLTSPQRQPSDPRADDEHNDSHSNSRESSLYRVRESFAGTVPSALSTTQPAPVPLSVPMTSEAYTQAVNHLTNDAHLADRASNLSVRVLGSLAACAAGGVQPPPRQLVWAGQQTLWVAYADGTVRAYWWPADATATVDSHGQPCRNHYDARIVFDGRLGSTQTTAPDQVVLSADARSPTLHYGFRCGDSADYHYGSFKLSYVANSDANALLEPVPVRSASLEFTALFSETVYGLRLYAGRFHAISQARRGGGPLYVSGLPRGNPLQAAEQAGMNPTTDIPLHQHILWDDEAQLAAHCQRCAAQLSELGEGDATGQRYGSSASDVRRALAQLHTVAHNVHALLIRSREADGVVAKESYPFQLLQRVHAHEMRLDALLLLIHCCGPDVLQRTLTDLLDLTNARATAHHAQDELQTLLEASMRSWAAPSARVDPDAHEEPTHTGGASTGNANLPASPAFAMTARADRVSLCIDVLLAHVPAATAVLDESRLTVASILSASTTMTPALALFLVYCSYHGLEKCMADNGTDTAEAETYRELEALREGFLLRFNQPTAWCGWALLAYAADHRLNVSLPPSPATSASRAEAVDEEATSPCERAEAHVSPARRIATRFALSHQLGVPPFEDLLAPLVTGMMQAGAFDAVFHLLGTVLACYPAASAHDLPAPLAHKLLFLAVQAGSTSMVEQLYCASGAAAPRVGDRTHWSALATHALAQAALTTQAREAAAPSDTPSLMKESCLEPLRGFITVASPEADMVEMVLQSHTDVLQREYLLLRFYVLTQRYADAVQTCHRIASATPAEAQRIQVVASYLASLCPYENPDYMARHGEAGARPRGPRADNEESTPEGGARGPAEHDEPHPWQTFTRVAPTALESSPHDLRHQLALTVRRLNPSAASARALGHGLVISGAVPVVAAHSAQGAGDRALRPSTILSSVARVPTSERSSSTATTAGHTHPRWHGDRNEEETGHDTENDDTGSAARYQQHHQFTRPATPPSSVNGFNRSLTCEAVIQRSGKVCGRDRPCPYHDKK